MARTTSTQDVILRAARRGAAEGLACLADEQTAGRGRQGRAWVAPPGSALLASVLVRRSPAVAAGIPFAAGLAVVDVLASCCGIEAGLKWPNDVLAGGGKLAGILSEVAPGASLGGDIAVVVGLGLNLRVERFPAGMTGVSLHALVHDPPDAEHVLLAWGDAFRVRITSLEEGGIAAVVAGWRLHAVGLGMPVTVRTVSGAFEGRALDIADDGALLVESDGGVRRVLAGDVHLSPTSIE